MKATPPGLARLSCSDGTRTSAQAVVRSIAIARTCMSLQSVLSGPSVLRMCGGELHRTSRCTNISCEAMLLVTFSPDAGPGLVVGEVCTHQ